jgi:hypothetical protein
MLRNGRRTGRRRRRCQRPRRGCTIEGVTEGNFWSIRHNPPRSLDSRVAYVRAVGKTADLAVNSPATAHLEFQLRVRAVSEQTVTAPGNAGDFWIRDGSMARADRAYSRLLCSAPSSHGNCSSAAQDPLWSHWAR